MPYHKDKQQAFQAAQQGVEELKDLYASLDRQSPEYGHHVKMVLKEINEANQQIENAMEVASEHQRIQLNEFREEINRISEEIE